MTSLQEAKLAREAEICYAVLAMVTDYDCWHPGHDAVTVTQVLDYLSRNVENSQKIVRYAVRSLPDARNCKCGSALAHAILSDRKKIPCRDQEEAVPTGRQVFEVKRAGQIPRARLKVFLCHFWRLVRLPLIQFAHLTARLKRFSGAQRRFSL